MELFINPEEYNKVFICFSGGRTSAYMLGWILNKYPDKEHLIVFANTGQEHPDTYRFIEDVGNYFGVNINWIESSIPSEGKCGFKEVTPSTSCRDHSLFENMIRRYGIPNMGFPHCTRELKTDPMRRFVRSKWGNEKYSTAIGIRADEIDRVSKNYEKNRYWYPLAWSGVTKEDVNDFWGKTDIDLKIPPRLGNCTWCWKKTYSKHMENLKLNPEIYNVPKLLEDRYGTCHIVTQTKRFGQRQPFFRKNKWTKDLMLEAEELAQQDKDEGYENSCKESCEPF